MLTAHLAEELAVLHKRHVGLNLHTLVRRFLPNWQIRAGKIQLFRPETVAIMRYRYRGARIPTPCASAPTKIPVPVT
jgi:RNA-directed DNA polymerase